MLNNIFGTVACACLDTSRRRVAQYSDKKEKPKSNVKFNLGFTWQEEEEIWRATPPLASRVVRYRLRLLGSAHSRFGSFASKKRYLIVFSSSPTTSSSVVKHNFAFLHPTQKGHLTVSFALCKGYKKDIFGGVLTGFERPTRVACRELSPAFTRLCSLAL